MQFPNTTYTAYVMAPEGPVNVSDAATSFDDVLDNAVATIWDGMPFRMFQQDFDVETNALESVSEVTEQAYHVLECRMEHRGINVAAE